MRRSLLMLILSLLLATGIVLTSSCAEKAEAPTQVIKDISVQEAFTLIQENRGNPDFIIIDVRTPEEFAGGHIEDAINVDFRSDNFRSEIDKLDKSKIYFIYCRSGKRSKMALDVMAELNFREVYNLSVGISQWEDEGFPVTK